MITQPPVRRRLIGSALRRYRENLGYALEDAARVLECDRSKISRIETGQRGIRPKELRELLAEYDVPRKEQTALVNLARRGGQHGWWDVYTGILPEPFIDYMVMEAAASEIMVYDAQIVPGLLQTAGYARAIAEADLEYDSAAQREQAVIAQMTRQQAVLAGRAPLSVVIAEAALRQRVGGPEIMEVQIRRLAMLADELPDVTVQVLPFAAGAHAAMSSASLAILRFRQAPGIGVVYLEALSGGVYRESQLDVARYVRAFTTLRAAALSAAQTAQLLRELAKR